MAATSLNLLRRLTQYGRSWSRSRRWALSTSSRAKPYAAAWTARPWPLSLEAVAARWMMSPALARKLGEAVALLASPRETEPLATTCARRSEGSVYVGVSREQSRASALDRYRIEMCQRP